MAFRIQVGDQSWSTDDLTLAEVVEIERETGESWVYMNPLRSARQARAILLRLLARDLGVDAAAAKVDAMRVVDVVGGIDVEQQDDRPRQHVDGVPQVDPKDDPAGSGTT